MPWQRHALDVALEVVPPHGCPCHPTMAPGSYVHAQVVVVVPRRAGKTRLLQAAALYRASQPTAFVWMTAQDGKNVAEKFRLELLPDLLNSPLAPYIRPRTSQGNERLSFDQGGVLKLFAPTAEQLHGFDGDMVVVDEAWSFPRLKGQALEAAARPIGLTRFGRFQFWVVSAGGDESSTWLDDWMQRGREGAAGVCYLEWAADPTDPAYDPYSLATIESAHPAVGHTIDARAILADADTMERKVYERSYLGVWERPSELATHKLDPALWAAGGAPNVETDGMDVVVVAVDVAMDRSMAAVVAAGRTGDQVAVEVIAHEAGVDWVAPMLRQLHHARPGVPIVLDALAAATVVAQLARAQVPVSTTNSMQMAQACQVLADLVNGGRLVHRDHHGLDVAVAEAGTRKLRDAWAWSRRDTAADISPLVAATLAAFGAMSTMELQPVSIAYGGLDDT